MAGSSWTNQVQNQVIVTGAGGGVYIYNGPPGPGNPPISWESNGGLTDPFGNPLPAVAGVAGSGSFSAGKMLITPSGTFIYK